MNDLTTGIALIAVVCVISVLLGFRIGRLKSRKASLGLQVLAGLSMAIYLGFLWNRPILSRLLPTSNLIILANWLPVWGCFFVGVYTTTRSINLLRRMVLGLVAVCACGYSIVAPVLGTSPQCAVSNLPNNSLLYQSTPHTCSAACAVSLLNLYGIDASEGELAELCLTREGTHWMGVYRGLKIKTQDTPWDVIAVPLDLESLKETRSFPGVLSVRIDVSGFPQEIDHGFRDDVGHSVLYLGVPSEERITVFDPSPDYGVEDWDHRVLDLIEEGVVLQLVPRNPDSADTTAISRNLANVLLGRKLTAGL